MYISFSCQSLSSPPNVANMFLKSLEIHGFKTFADRTKVDFHPGITAIVGPNGCGKSNVLDSVRWALGEQSAKALRGAQMQDVIFNGTDNRKPLGMAEVSLTFSDCEEQLGVDYHEVTVTRRLFRDGHSEYELNKQGCRLRDIQDLFMGTGIGRSAYSIMEQGKIDMIVSAKPEDRRAVFEEASGITKFKSQKKEALRKLELTEANLLRTEDIIREVKRQIGSLQRQAGKARRYKELLDDLRGMETNLAKHQFDIFTREITGQETKLSGLLEQQRQLTVSVETQDMELQSIRAEMEAIDNKIQDLRRLENEARMAIDRAGQKRQYNEARVQEYTATIEQTHREIAGVEEKIHVQQEQRQSVQAGLDEALRLLNETESACRTRETELRDIAVRIHSHEATRAELAAEIESKEKHLIDLRSQLAALDLQQRNFTFRVESMRGEQLSWEQKHLEAEKRNADDLKRLQEVEQSQKEIQARCQAIESEMAAAALRTSEAEKGFRQAEHAQQTRVAQRDALVKLEKAHAGSSPATQEVLNHANSIGAKILGTLADHLQTRAGYEKPMALLLGESVNALLVEGRTDVEVVTQYLRDQNARQITLAPLAWSGHIAADTGVATTTGTTALQFVQADAVAAPLVSLLLKNAHIVEDLSAALELKASQPEATIAARTGELITSAGLVYLGQQGGGGLAVLERQNEIRRLDESIDSGMTELTSLKQAWEAASAEHRSKAQNLQGAQSAANMTAIDEAKLRHTHETSLEALRQVKQSIEKLAGEYQTLFTQDQANQERHAELQNTVRQAEEAIAITRENHGALDEKIRATLTEEEQARQFVTELKIQLATQAQQRDNWLQQQNQVVLRMQELEELMAERKRAVADYESRLQSARETIVLADQERVAAEGDQQRLEVELKQKQADKEQRQSQIHERENALRVQRKELHEVQEARTEIDRRLTEERFRLDNLRERMQRLYQTRLEDIAAVTEETPDWNEIERQVSEKRERLEAMGPVNLEAIVEYDELEQRYNFLQEQQTDMVNSKTQLMEAIAQINRTTREMFAETFEKIRTNFQNVFVELFGGGSANLVLLDENDPLECGIDIIAKPPGKQPRSILLLSGGEKALTAVSLIFAIYQVKPSPFCILDEMDAPLDESNVGRFINIVKRFVEQSQFVLITHNKRSIASSDAMYGVSMQEKGVSRLLSYRMTKTESSEHNPLAHSGGRSHGPGIATENVSRMATEADLPSEPAAEAAQ